jgi:hypothetical protein
MIGLMPPRQRDALPDRLLFFLTASASFILVSVPMTGTVRDLVYADIGNKDSSVWTLFAPALVGMLLLPALLFWPFLLPASSRRNVIAALSLWGVVALPCSMVPHMPLCEAVGRVGLWPCSAASLWLATLLIHSLRPSPINGRWVQAVLLGILPFVLFFSAGLLPCVLLSGNTGILNWLIPLFSLSLLLRSVWVERVAPRDL